MLRYAKADIQRNPHAKGAILCKSIPSSERLHQAAVSQHHLYFVLTNPGLVFLIVSFQMLLRLHFSLDFYAWQMLHGSQKIQHRFLSASFGGRARIGAVSFFVARYPGVPARLLPIPKSIVYWHLDRGTFFLYTVDEAIVRY